MHSENRSLNPFFCQNDYLRLNVKFSRLSAINYKGMTFTFLLLTFLNRTLLTYSITTSTWIKQANWCLSSIWWSICLFSLRWCWDLNPWPRSTAWIVSHQRSPLDQEGSLSNEVNTDNDKLYRFLRDVWSMLFHK